MAGRWRTTAVVGLLGMAMAACSSPGSPGAAGDDGAGGAGGDDAAPYTVGLVYSKTGPLATYGKEYREGFQVGLDYATGGTGEVDGHKIVIKEADDAGDPAKAVSAATKLIGNGAKVIAGSTSSGVALQVAPLAEDNKVLFVSGPAATDAITGINKYTFRSGRQTYQDIRTAGTIIGDVKGKRVTVFAQDSAFGQANVAGVKAVLGAEGATVTSVAVPANATDLTPFATTLKEQKPDLVFVAWAGTNATQMWRTLSQQGVFEHSTVVTGLDIKASYPAFGPVASKITFLSHFFDGAADNKQYQALDSGLRKARHEVDLFSTDGFTGAQMVVHALKKGKNDPDAMVQALEGWKFDGPKGAMTIRAADHALLQPMFTATLVKSGKNYRAKLVDTLSPEQVAPPVAKD